MRRWNIGVREIIRRRTTGVLIWRYGYDRGEASVAASRIFGNGDGSSSGRLVTWAVVVCLLGGFFQLLILYRILIEVQGWHPLVESSVIVPVLCVIVRLNVHATWCVMFFFLEFIWLFV